MSHTDRWVLAAENTFRASPRLTLPSGRSKTTRYLGMTFLRSPDRDALRASPRLLAVKLLDPRRLRRHDRGISTEPNPGRRNFQLREFCIRESGLGGIEPGQHAWLMSLNCGSDFGFVGHVSSLRVSLSLLPAVAICSLPGCDARCVLPVWGACSEQRRARSTEHKADSTEQAQSSSTEQDMSYRHQPLLN